MKKIINISAHLWIYNSRLLGKS